MSAPFAHYLEGLREQLTRELGPLTLAFFRELPDEDAEAIAALVGDGRKLRGCVTLALCDALGGTIAAALPSAVAVECIHAASLIHDDLVDGDGARRDRPATWTVLGARRAVLTGDVIFATALARSAEISSAAVRVLSQAIARVAAGAYCEPVEPGELRAIVASDAVAPSLYEYTIRLKTGALFGAAAELGAIAAGAATAQRRAAFEFGAHLGEAFQIADDLEDAVRQDATALSPQQRATLATIVARFAPTRDVAGRGTAPGHRGSTAEIAAAMEAAIDQRVTLARLALERMASPRARSLRDLPLAILGPRIATARPSCAADVSGAD